MFNDLLSNLVYMLNLNEHLAYDTLNSLRFSSSVFWKLLTQHFPHSDYYIWGWHFYNYTGSGMKLYARELEASQGGHCGKFHYSNLYRDLGTSHPSLKGKLD